MAATPTEQVVIGLIMLVVGAALAARFPTRWAGLSRGYTLAVRAGWVLVAVLGFLTTVIGVVRLV